MTPAATLARLRAISAERRRLDAEEEQLLTELAGDDAAPSAAVPESSALVPLAEAAAALGISYDATRKAAKRAEKSVRVGRESFVWRTWLEERRLSGVSGRLPDMGAGGDVESESRDPCCFSRRPAQ